MNHSRLTPLMMMLLAMSGGIAHRDPPPTIIPITEPPWWRAFVAEMVELGCKVGEFDDATGNAEIEIPEGVLEAAKAIMARYKDPSVSKL